MKLIVSRRLVTAALLPMSLAPMSVLPFRVQAQPAAPARVQPVAMAAGVAATVNGENIATDDVERGLKAVLERQPALAADTPEAKKARDTWRNDVLDILIEQRLMLQEARRLKLIAKPAEVDARLVQYKASNRFKTDAELQAALTKEGKTPADLRNLLSQNIAREQLLQTWIADITVADADVATFYAANPPLFTEPETVRARHILLAVKPGATAQERAQIKAKAQSVWKQASAANANFSALARQNSDDPGSKEVGGDLGYFGRGMMVKPFEDAAFAATVGKVTAPIESPFGYHIILVDDKKPERKVPLAEIQADARAKAAVKKAVLDQKRQERVEGKIRDLKTKAKIQKGL